MKKLLALMLAFLMPLCALAETYGLSIRLDAESEAFAQTIKDELMAQGIEADAAEKEATLIQTLIDGLGVEAIMEEAAYSAVVYLCGSPLFDLTAYETGEKTLVTSSMMPGYAFAAPVEEQESTELVVMDDLSTVGMSILPVVDTWLNGLEKSESRGIFVGDAFAGGSKCTTWALDDQDIAALVDQLLTEEVRAALLDVYSVAEMNGEDILREIDHMTANVAMENRYAYLVRIVQAADDQLVGVSLTVMQDGVQAATLSLGFPPEGVRLVAGLGLEQQNYWCEIIADSKAEEAEKIMNLSIREWAASKENAFAYVQAVTAPENVWNWNQKTSTTEGKHSWQGEAKANGTMLLTTNGMYDPETAGLDGEITLCPAEKKLLSLHIQMGKREPIPALDKTLVECSMTEPADAALYEQLNEQLTAAILARLLKVLPLELILQMNPFTLP